MHELQMFHCHELTEENYGSACMIRQPRWQARSFTMTSRMLRQRLGRCTRRCPWRRSRRRRQPGACTIRLTRLDTRMRRLMSMRLDWCAQQWRRSRWRRRLRRRRRRSTSLAKVEVDLQQSAPCAWTRPSLRYTGPASADTASVKFAATVCYRRAMSYVLSVEARSRRTFLSSMCCSVSLHSNAMPLPRMSAELWRRTSTPSASGPTGHTSSAQSKRGVSERCWRCFVARIRQVPDGAGTIGVSF